VKNVSKVLKNILPATRLKRFIFRFICVAGKWTRRGRQNILKLYTDRQRRRQKENCRNGTKQVYKPLNIKEIYPAQERAKRGAKKTVRRRRNSKENTKKANKTKIKIPEYELIKVKIRTKTNCNKNQLKKVQKIRSKRAKTKPKNQQKHNPKNNQKRTKKHLKKTTKNQRKNAKKKPLPPRLNACFQRVGKKERKGRKEGEKCRKSAS
jgi:hypothetical protein